MKRKGGMTFFDHTTGIEFDVVKIGRVWYASDDNCRRHFGLTARDAIRRGIKRNRKD